jgi:hypothetical protein
MPTSQLFITLFIPVAIVTFISVPVAVLIPLQMYLGLDVVPFLSGMTGRGAGGDAGSGASAGGAGAGGAKPEAPAGFEKGDLITANWLSRGRWFPGKIATVNADSTFNIKFDDGDKESSVPAARIRRRKGGRSAAQTYKVGDNILGNWNAKGRLYPGRIVRVNADDTYDVDYNDGDKEKRVPTSRLTCASKPCGSSGSAAGGAEGRNGMLDDCAAVPDTCSLASVKKACHYLQNSGNKCGQAFSPEQGRCLMACWARVEVADGVAGTRLVARKKGSINLCKALRSWKELVCNDITLKNHGDGAAEVLGKPGAP